MNQIFLFLLRPVYFLFSFKIEPCLFSRKSRNMYFSLNQIRLSNGQAYKERIVKKAKLEISGSHR